MKHTDRTILITGGTAGIGLAFARKFLELRNQVIVTGRRQSTLVQLKASYHLLRGGALSYYPLRGSSLRDRLLRRTFFANAFFAGAFGRRSHNCRFLPRNLPDRLPYGIFNCFWLTPLTMASGRQFQSS